MIAQSTLVTLTASLYFGSRWRECECCEVVASLCAVQLTGGANAIEPRSDKNFQTESFHRCADESGEKVQPRCDSLVSFVVFFSKVSVYWKRIAGFREEGRVGDKACCCCCRRFVDGLYLAAAEQRPRLWSGSWPRISSRRTRNLASSVSR